MSVNYILSKKVKIGDLRKAGFKIKDCRNKKNCYPFLITNESRSGVSTSVVKTDETNNIDNWEIKEFEGWFHYGGVGVIFEICDKLGCKFITDKDIDDAIYTNSEITEETFDIRMEDFKKYVSVIKE